MKRLGMIVVFALAFTLPACKRSTPPAEVYPTRFVDDGVGAQGRLSRHLEQSVVPKLRSCWSQLPGEGAVAMDVSYRKSGGNWTFDKFTITKSTVAKDQEPAVQQCVENAVRATSFPVEQGERLETVAEQFVARLAVPVPLPAEGTQLTTDQIARMVSTGGSGDVAGCSECVSRTEYPYGLKCESRKSGGHLDCKEHTSNVCSTAPTACLRGVFSGAGGVIMY